MQNDHNFTFMSPRLQECTTWLLVIKMGLRGQWLEHWQGAPEAPCLSPSCILIFKQLLHMWCCFGDTYIYIKISIEWQEKSILTCLELGSRVVCQKLVKVGLMEDGCVVVGARGGGIGVRGVLVMVTQHRVDGGVGEHGPQEQWNVANVLCILL